MSFLKHEPPKPTLAFKNLLPILESVPIAFEISVMFASVFSHKAEILLMDEMRWARKAFATSFESSELHRLLVRILSRGIQFA